MKYDMDVLIQKLKNFNHKNKEYEGYAYLKFYDDESGGVYYNEDAGYDHDLCSFENLLEDY